MSSRANIYKDYFSALAPMAAARVLLFFGLGVLAVEAAMNCVDPQYERTAVNSLHGVRAILQQALGDGQSKMLCFGDSSLVGGGIYRHDQTVAGYLAREIEGPRVYNLALPGGDNLTSALLLDQLRLKKISNVDRVVIETLAAKWLATSPSESQAAPKSVESCKELQRLIPGLGLQDWGIDVEPLGRTESIEIAAQWQLGRYSKLYRHRDYFRTEVIGNYPAFWVAGRLIPRSILSRLYPEKARGTNRLAARMDDFDFDAADAKPASGGNVSFSGEEERKYLLKAISTARSISRNPPIILAFPLHFEFQVLGAETRRSYLNAVQEFEADLKNIAADTGSELMVVRSEEFQNPAYWTVTPFHFNAVGARKIWEMLRPQFCRLYGCQNKG
jgi:hypothetical protein